MGYLEPILVHPMGQQTFAGKLQQHLCKIWDLVVQRFVWKNYLQRLIWDWYIKWSKILTNSLYLSFLLSVFLSFCLLFLVLGRPCPCSERCRSISGDWMDWMDGWSSYVTGHLRAPLVLIKISLRGVPIWFEGLEYKRQQKESKMSVVANMQEQYQTSPMKRNPKGTFYSLLISLWWWLI